jgi:hypothetical protein
MKIAVWIATLGLAATGFAADMSYKGYLADTYCGSAGMSKMDGSDLTNAPAEHTVACQIACAKGGYGVMVQEGKTYKFVPFDAKGNALAAALLKNTKKTKALYIEVAGSKKMDAISVSSLKEASM